MDVEIATFVRGYIMNVEQWLENSSCKSNDCDRI